MLPEAIGMLVDLATFRALVQVGVIMVELLLVGMSIGAIAARAVPVLGVLLSCTGGSSCSAIRVVFDFSVIIVIVVILLEGIIHELFDHLDIGGGDGWS